MLNRITIDNAISKEDNIASILKISESVCNKVFSKNDVSSYSNYTYDYNRPINELGLDEELISQLLEDYISQIFKTYDIFHNILDNITQTKGIDKEAKLIDLKNLAHKNLGVVRNLRIDDAQILLSDLMSNHQDIKHLRECVEALMGCAFKLNPDYAFNVLKLQKIKETF